MSGQPPNPFAAVVDGAQPEAPPIPTAAPELEKGVHDIMGDPNDFGQGPSKRGASGSWSYASDDIETNVYNVMNGIEVVDDREGVMRWLGDRFNEAGEWMQRNAIRTPVVGKDIEGFSQGVRRGRETVELGILGRQAMRGEITTEELLARKNATHVRFLDAQIEEYNKSGPSLNLLGVPVSVQSAISGTGSSIPLMWEGLKGKAAGAAAGWGARIASSAAIAALDGPEPGPADAGALISFGALSVSAGDIGGITAMAGIFGGLEYADLVERGIDPQRAKGVAWVSGGIQAVLENTGINILGKAGKQSFARAMRGQSGKDFWRAVLTGYLRETGEEVSTETLQKAAAEMAYLTAKYTEDETYQDKPLKEILYGAFMDVMASDYAILQEGVGAAAPSAGMVAGSKVTGATLGATKAQMSDIDFRKHLADLVKAGKAADAWRAAQFRRAQQRWGWGVAKKVVNEAASGDMDITEVIELFKVGMEAARSDADMESRADELIEQMRDMSDEEIGEAIDLLFTKEMDAVEDRITREDFLRELDEAGGAEYVRFGDDGTVTLGASASYDVGFDDVNAEATLGGFGTEVADNEDIGASAIGRSDEPVVIPAGKEEVRARKTRVTEEINSVDEKISALEAEFQRRETGTPSGKPMKKTKWVLEAEARVEGAEAVLRAAQADNAGIVKAEQELDEAYEELFDAQEAQAEVHKSRRGGIPTNTDAIVTKLEKLYDQRENLEIERSLLEQGLVSNTDLQGKKGSIPIDKLTALKAKGVMAQIREYARGFREGTVVTKVMVSKVQRELTQLVRRSGLPKKDHGEFLSVLKSVQTPAQLVRKMPQIEDTIVTLVERSSLEFERSRLTKLMKASKPTQSGRFAKGKFTADIQRVLDTYKQMIGDTTPDERAVALADKISDAEREFARQKSEGEVTKGTVKKLDSLYKQQQKMKETAAKASNARNDAEQALIDAINAGKKPTPEQVMAAVIAREVGDVKGKTSAELRALNDQLESLMKFGKSMAARRKKEELEQKAEELETAIDDIQGQRPVGTTPESDTSATGNGLVRIARQTARSIGIPLSSWDVLMATLSQHSPAFKNKDRSPLMDLLDTHESVRNNIIFRQKWREKMQDAFLQAFGNESKGVKQFLKGGRYNQILEKVARDSSIKEEIGRFNTPDGPAKVLTMTRAQARALYMHFMNPRLRPGLTKGNEYSTYEQQGVNSTEALLEQYLTPEDKVLMDAQLKITDEFYDEINAFWREKHGVDLVYEEFYTRVKRRKGAKDAAEETPFFSAIHQTSMTPGSATARVNSTLAIEPQNDIQALMEHIEDWGHYITHVEWYEKATNIFGNPAVKHIIKSKYGEKVLSQIAMQMDLLTGTYRSAGDIQWLDSLRRRTASAFVGGKLGQVSKQMTATFGFMQYVSPQEYVEGFTAFINDPFTAIEIMESSPMLKERGQTFDPDLKEYLRSDAFLQLKTAKRLADFLMMPTIIGDRLSIYAGGYSVYLAEMRKSGNHEQALKAFERAFEDTQQSGNMNKMSNFQQANSLTKFASLFLTYPIQQTMKEIMMLRLLAKNPTPHRFKQFVRIVALNRFIAVLFQALVSGLPGFGEDDDDNDERLMKLMRASVLGNWNGLPLTGDVVNYGATVFTNKLFNVDEHTFTPQFMPLQMMTSAVQFFPSFDKLMFEDGSMEQFWKTVNLAVRSAPLIPGIGRIPWAAFTKPAELKWGGTEETEATGGAQTATVDDTEAMTEEEAEAYLNSLLDDEETNDGSAELIKSGVNLEEASKALDEEFKELETEADRIKVDEETEPSEGVTILPVEEDDE